MSQSDLSAYDRARRAAFPSEGHLRSLGFYSEELAPFLAEYKAKNIGFQPVQFQEKRKIPSVSEAPSENDVRVKDRKILLSERLRGIQIDADKS